MLREERLPFDMPCNQALVFNVRTTDLWLMEARTLYTPIYKSSNAGELIIIIIIIIIIFFFFGGGGGKEWGLGMVVSN